MPSRRSFWFILKVLVVTLSGAGALQAAPWEFFALDNGVGRGVWSPEQQASVLKETGFDGISYNYTTPADLERWLPELKSRGLRLYGLYFGARVDGDTSLPAGLQDAVKLLRGSGAVLWLTLPNATTPGSHDDQAVKQIRAVADLAASAGLRVVLYPHFGFHLATAEHALALIARVERANVELSVNLCHELAAGNGARLPDIIRKVAPSLGMVSLNGASDRPEGGWSNYIKVLGTGGYDLKPLLRALAEVHYTGPVGLQSYNLPGEPKSNLESARRAWSELTSSTVTR